MSSPDVSLLAKHFNRPRSCGRLVANHCIEDVPLASAANPAAAPVAQPIASRDERLTLMLCIGWGLGTLALGALFNTTAVLLMRYLTDYVGLAAALAGLLISASKIYDALTDPWMGAISDRTQSALGRRRPWLLLGSVLCGLALVALFNVPTGLTGHLLTAYVGLLLLLFASAYTVFGVPYMAMPAEMTSDYQERARLMSFRVGFSGLSQLLAGYGAPMLIVFFGDGARGHSVMGVVVGFAVMVAGLLCFAMTRSARQTIATMPVPTSRPSIASQFRMLRSNRPFMLVVLSKLALLIAVSSFGASFTYFVVHVLRETYSQLGTFALTSTAAMFVSLPLWLALIKRVDKRRAYISAALAYSCVSLSWLLAGQDEPQTALIVRAVFMGVLGCGTLLAGQSMLPDAIENDYLQSGERREAVLAGFYTMAEKLAGAVGLAATGAMLGALGYVSSTAGRMVEQPESALYGIRIGVAVVPTVMLLLSCALLLRYDLGPERLAMLRVSRSQRPAAGESV